MIIKLKKKNMLKLTNIQGNANENNSNTVHYQNGNGMKKWSSSNADPS